MRLPNSLNRHVVGQTALFCLLSVCPLAMIMLNGKAAVRSLLASEVTSSSNQLKDEVPSAEGEAPPPLKYGVYDPAGDFADYRGLSIRHTYISWIEFDQAALATQLREWTAAGIEPLVTIEPWPQSGQEKTLLADIVAGRYDEAIDQVAATLSDIEGPVYLSWGHEMDQDLTVRYPWSGRDPEAYVAAYRYVVDRLRQSLSSDVHWVWAGVMKQGSLRYWPGDDYVDYVGLPIYCFPAWDRKTYGYIRDFRTTLNEKLSHVRGINKPLFITELGVSGSDDFEQYWMHQTFLALDEVDNLSAVVFFQAADTEGVWGADMATPDWRVPPDLIRGLVNWKLSSREELSGR